MIIDFYKVDNLFLTEEQRAENIAKTQNDVEDIVASLTSEDRKLFGLNENDEKYKTPEEYKLVVNRNILKVEDVPVAFFDINEYDYIYNVVVATRNGEVYRDKGYALKVVKEGINWYNKNKYKLKKPIIWWTEKNNIGSQKLAEKAGFKRDYSIEEDEEWNGNNYWIKYIYE